MKAINRGNEFSQNIIVILNRAFVIASVMACVGNGFAQTLSIQSGSTIGAAQADSIVQIAAESQGLAQVAPADLPIIGGTFWWVMPGGAAVPAPCPPLDLSGAIYQIAEGQFLVDETGGQVVANTPQFGLQAQATSSTVASEVASQVDALVNLITRVQTAAANQQVWTMARAMGMDVPSPGSDGGSGDGSDYTSSYVPYIFDTNGLWLEITGVSNGQVDLNLHNPTNEVYAIWCTTNLLGNWNVETELWPTPDQTNVLPFTVANLDRQNLFVRAEDWTGVDSDGDGIPDWWIWFYFGNLSETATNLDSQDNTLLYDYTNGLDPNVIQFTLSTASQYINTLTVPVQINLLAGVPSYYAVLVNDINQADANWQTFPGTNITVILGSTNGVYTVSVGLRGLPPNATATWQTVQLTLNTIAPTVVITNPAAGVVSQPMIQVQGFANEALSHVTFDVSNATGIFTNQTGYITSQYYDANLLTFTTNYFQCYDVPLTNGLNTISVHTTDLAGNTTTTNVNFILDYSNATNPPVLTVVWPQDGTYISGSSFTFEGQVDDDTASVTATIVDASGDTNTVQGLVERSGAVWAQNLPLAAGTNTLMISATDAAGNTSTTNLTLYQSSVTVTVNPLAGDQLNRQFITVTGTVSDTTVQVYVNGVQATVNDDGTWEADNVLVSPAGMAKLDVEIFSSGSSPAIVHAAKTGLTVRANDSLTAGNLGSQLGFITQPARVVLSGYFGTRYYQSPTNLFAYSPANVSWNEDDEVDWTYDAGGSWYFYAANLIITANGNDNNVTLSSYGGLSDLPLPLSPDTDGFISGTVDPNAEWAWAYDGWSEPPVTLSLADTDGPGLNFVNPPWEFSALNANIGFPNPYSLQRDTRTTVMIVPSLPAASGQTNVYLVRAAAREFSDPLSPNVFGPATVNYNLLMFAPYPYPTTWDVPAGWNPGWLPTTPTRYLGDVPLPPEWLQINGQTLINSGITNTDGAVWGLMVTQALAGATVDVTPAATNVYQNWDYTFDVQVIKLWPPAVDNNRDGNITFDGSDATTPGNPYRFWVNDAQENGDISDASHAVPGQSASVANYHLSHVNGRSDLVNFFPAALCLSNVLQWLPPTNGWEYHLSQADSAVKFVYASLTTENAFSYLTDLNSYGYGTNADEWVTNADTIQVVPSSATGTVLDTNWLEMVQNNGGYGVILMEGCAATTQPLTLELWHKDQNGVDQKMGGVPLYISIGVVEQMYRWINLRGAIGAAETKHTDITEPVNNPDSLSDGKNFIFVHGYSVSETAARGWSAEMFKRLYQSHSRAMFTAVDWYGNDGQIAGWVPFAGGATPDYYTNVANAFLTASNLAVAVNALPGQKYIAGHSLGNMVVSSASADWGLNANTYFAIDAAVAMEAYNASASDNLNLVPPPYWINYSNRLWASKWYQLFDSSDARSTLTWSNRFGNIPNAYNYYSSTEDVLKDADGTLHSITSSQFAWVNQEMRKGSFLVGLVANDEAGWGFHSLGLDGYSNYTIEQANNIPDSQLRTNSFFGHFDDANLYTPGGGTDAANYNLRAQILGDGIPALSNPAGANSLGNSFGVPDADRNMNDFKGLNINGLWPRSGDDWQHSDIVNIAYPFNHAVFNQIVTDGGLR